MYNHDPLCMWSTNATPDPLPGHDCWDCELIDKVRKDQTQRNIEQVQRMCAHTKYEGCRPCLHDQIAEVMGAPVSDTYVSAQDMLAKCIAAVEALPPKYNESYLHDMQSVLAALRALSANADSDRNVSERRQEKS